jgi:hypothetical protein
MSDIDTGYDGYNNEHVDAAHEDYDLDQAHQAYGNEHDASQQYDAYGEANHHEADQHYNHGEAEHYHAPDGTDYSKVEYTNYDSHVEASEAAYGEHYSAHQYDASFSELDSLEKHFSADFLHADFESYGDHGDRGYEGGEQELSAASK